jgi:hypothetical protein
MIMTMTYEMTEQRVKSSVQFKIIKNDWEPNLHHSHNQLNWSHAVEKLIYLSLLVQ